MRDPKAYLALMCSSAQLGDKWLYLQQLYEKRLWHELTEELLSFVKIDVFKQHGGLVQMYEQFISDFEHRINQLSLVELIVVIAGEIREPQVALELFQKTKEKVKNNVQAKVLCLTAIGLIYLHIDRLDAAKEVIKDAQGLLDTIDGVTTVHGRFYDLSSTYHKVVGSYNDFYRDALRFLGCMDIKQIPQAELKQRAFNLSLAALLGSDVYNFGELLAHDVLAVLSNGEHQWLVDLLFAFNSGNIKKFYELKPFWSNQLDLAANESGLLQKISLLCLMEITFKRKSTDRSLAFELIAGETQLPVTDVEHLVMKALSLGLIKGSIDEVNQMVHITWVQPRVLDRSQIQTIRDLLEVWAEKVKSSSFMIESQVPELLVT